MPVVGIVNAHAHIHTHKKNPSSLLLKEPLSGSESSRNPSESIAYMYHDALRKRGAEHPSLGSDTDSGSPSPFLRRSLHRLRQALSRPRSQRENQRLLYITVGVVTLLFLFLCLGTLLLHPTFASHFLAPRDERPRQRGACPTDTLLHVPPLRSVSAAGAGTADQNDVLGAPPFAFRPPNGSELGGHPLTVAGLTAYCAAQVAAVPAWDAGSWRRWLSRDAEQQANVSAAAFRLPISTYFLREANYTATGSPFCLADGALYLPESRLAAGGSDAFAAEGITVRPLRDAVLRSAAAADGVRVVPAMGLMVTGYWIATHFFHLVTDVLEGLHAAFENIESGVLQRIPTQTVLVHRRSTNWFDRHGDRPRKLEFSAALANSFSSPALTWQSPYNSSFIFRAETKECAGRDNVAEKRRAPKSSVASSAVVSAACFCDGLLVTRQNPAYMNYSVFYRIQDVAARQFRAPPYEANRSVFAMEKLRTGTAPAWATQFWSDAPLPSLEAHVGTARENAADVRRDAKEGDGTTMMTTKASPLLPYAPRVLFVHRTSRLIANASLYAAWMRRAGFRVEEVYLERLSAAQQYHLGRYADVVVAMHGLGIGHAMWMEREPHHCRTVIEFRPWVIQAMPVIPQRTLGQSMKFSFVPILPIDVRFGPSVAEPEKERELLLSFTRINSAYSFPSFTDQTAIYDDAEVQRVIAKVREHLESCLPR